VELEVEDLNVDGGAVARRDGLVYFLDRALPGSLVRARVTGLKKKRAEARVLEVLRSSPDAVPSFCAHFGECGGCSWQDMDYAAQLRWKRQRIQEALRRLAGVEVEVPPVLASPLRRGFRNKMEYAFAPDQGGINTLLGLRQRASRALCAVEECALQPEGAAFLCAVRAWLRDYGLDAWALASKCLEHFILRDAGGDVSGRRLAAELLCGPKPLPAGAGRALWVRLEGLGATGLLVSGGGRRGERAGKGRTELFGAGVLNGRVGHLRLQFPLRGFMQTNGGAMELLYSQVRDLAALSGGERVWELYAGAGALGLFLADKAGELLGVEWDKQAVRAAQANAAALGFGHCRFLAGDAAVVLPGLEGRPDLLVADPPRSGLAPGVCAAIRAKAPARMIYVSCDPGSLARDLALLAPDYRTAALRLVDMFPHTPHMESAALLVRERS
jgi:23S rRNA (uracil1939-C5)-methyltransferase